MELRKEKLETIIAWVQGNKDIRMVLLTSSLVNPLATVDEFSDLDIELGTRTIRFGQLDSIMPHISRKVLTEQLKELEEDELLERLAYKEIPPRVEYKLSEKGVAFFPILENIKEWNLKYEVAPILNDTV